MKEKSCCIVLSVHRCVRKEAKNSSFLLDLKMPGGVFAITVQFTEYMEKLSG